MSFTPSVHSYFGGNHFGSINTDHSPILSTLLASLILGLTIRLIVVITSLCTTKSMSRLIIGSQSTKPSCHSDIILNPDSNIVQVSQGVTSIEIRLKLRSWPMYEAVYYLIFSSLMKGKYAKPIKLCHLSLD